MLKLVYKVGSRGGAMVSTSARNAGDPWFESRSWYNRFLYVNIHLFIYIYIYKYIYIYIYIYIFKGRYGAIHQTKIPLVALDPARDTIMIGIFI